MKITPPPIATVWDLKHLERCDPSVRTRRLIELAIVRRMITDFVKLGYTITVDGDDDEAVRRCVDEASIMDAVFAVDDCWVYVHDKPKGKAFAWVRLILGNDGWDVISDHTVNLEEHLKGVNEYAEQLSVWCR